MLLKKRILEKKCSLCPLETLQPFTYTTVSMKLLPERLPTYLQKIKIHPNPIIVPYMDVLKVSPDTVIFHVTFNHVKQSVIVKKRPKKPQLLLLSVSVPAQKMKFHLLLRFLQFHIKNQRPFSLIQLQRDHF